MSLRVTLGDIARACGVGKSTVARVLSGDPHVSTSSRTRVLAKAKELGYSPDPGLRALSQHRWKHLVPKAPTLAVLNTNPAAANVLRSYRPSLLSAARRLGYELAEFSVSDYPSIRRLGEVLYNRGIRGLIIPPVIHAFDWNLDWSHFCSIGCGIGEYRLPIHSVDINYFNATRLCWKQCLSRGYKRIGSVLYRQPGPDTNDSLRYAAIYYEQSLLPKGHVCIPPFSGNLVDFKQLREWYIRYKPDVIIGLNSLPHWNLREFFKPDLAHVGFCCIIHDGEMDAKELCGTTSHHTRIAESSMTWLDQLLRNNELGLPTVSDEILVDPLWLEGSTMRPPQTPASL